MSEIDDILKCTEDVFSAIGEWRDSAVLGGGVALLIYDRYLAPQSSNPVGTADMDVLISRKPEVASQIKKLDLILEEKGF